MSREMEKFISKVEARTGLRKEDYADKLLFMSHETYTPARGGSADAKVTALESAFAGHLSSICISNTKGFTGHTLGAAIEDVVLVKALQKRKAPPIANLKKIPDHFKKLNFSGQDKITSEYGLHLAAGFGSHFAFMFVKRIEENPVEGNARYQMWLKEITGSGHPEVKVIDNTLCAVAGGEALPMKTTQPAKVEAPVTKPVAMPVSSAAPAVVRPPVPEMAAEPVAAQPVAATGILNRIKAIIAEQTGYAADMLEDGLDLEADLGIDTVKQVEIFAKISATFGFSVPDDLKLRDLNTIARLGDYIAVKTGKSAKDSVLPIKEDIKQSQPALKRTERPSNAIALIKEVIAEQTGYAADMLEEGLDLEADLGIDTVKQVEIFAKISANFGFSVPDDLKLRDLNTIAKLGEYVHARLEPDESAKTVKEEPAILVPAFQDNLAVVKEVIAEPAIPGDGNCWRIGIRFP